jgi:rhamnose transport system permease protein
VKLAQGDIAAGANSLTAGRLGTIEIQADEVILGKPLIFNKSNIDRFNF